jgi:hypothetical protein
MPVNKRSLNRQRKRLRVLIANATAFTIDISPGGFCVELMHVQKPGTDVTGTLSMGEQNFPFTGQVAWARSGDMRLNQRGRMGIRLTGIENSYYQLFTAPPSA